MSDARFRSSRSALSHPFHDETVKRMGHPAGAVPVGNRLLARERVPTVLRKLLVGPALIDILHTVHGVVLVDHRIGARAAGSRRPDDLGLVADSIVRHLLCTMLDRAMIQGCTLTNPSAT